MYQVDARVDGATAVRRARVIVIAALCLLLITKTADAVNSGPGQVPFVVALFVLPFLYVIPATRPWWGRHRFWLLGVQAVLTYLQFAVFGNGWVAGVSGLLGGLVLLTVAAPASWLLYAALMMAEAVLWTALGGYPFLYIASGTVYLLIAYVNDSLLLFGLGWLADMVAKVHAARDELAGLAVTRERLHAAEALQSAVGERLMSVAALAGGGLSALARSRALARERIAQAGVVARRALADVRAMTAGSGDPVRPEAAGPLVTGAAVAPRLARAVLAVVLCGFAAASVNLNLAAHVSHWVTVMAVADAVAIVALQWRHSWPREAGARPRAWPWTLALQAALTYAMLPFLGPFRGLVFSAFLVGSALLLFSGRWAWAAFTAVLISQGVAYAISPFPDAAAGPEISNTVFLVGLAAWAGLLVFGLSRLAGLAVQLEALRGELVAAAVLRERLRVARDTHDLLGLGLSAIALKTDVVLALIGRDDARARGRSRRCGGSALRRAPTSGWWSARPSSCRWPPSWPRSVRCWPRPACRCAPAWAGRCRRRWGRCWRWCCGRRSPTCCGTAAPSGA
jgi:two-component system sensor histidine kinase DesK